LRGNASARNSPPSPWDFINSAPEVKGELYKPAAGWRAGKTVQVLIVTSTKDPLFEGERREAYGPRFYDSTRLMATAVEIGL